MPKATRGEALNGVEAKKFLEAPVKGAESAPIEKKNAGASPSQNSTSLGTNGAPPSSSNGNPAPAPDQQKNTTPPAKTTQFPQPASFDGSDFTKTALAGAGKPPAPLPLDNGNFTKTALAGAQIPAKKRTAKQEREDFNNNQAAKADHLRRKISDSQNFLEKDYIEAAQPFDQFGKMAASLYGSYVRNSGGNPQESIVNRGIVPSTEETAKKVGHSLQGIKQYRSARAEQLSNDVKDIEGKIEKEFLTSDYFGEAIGKNYGTHYNKSSRYKELVAERTAKLDRIAELNNAAKSLAKKLAVTENIGKKPIAGVTTEERIGKAIREASGDFDVAADTKNLAFLQGKKNGGEDDNEKQYTEKLRLKNFHEGAQALSDYHDEKLDAAYKAGKPKIDHVLDLADQLEEATAGLKSNNVFGVEDQRRISSIQDQFKILKSDPEVAHYFDTLAEYQKAGDRITNALDKDFPQTKRQQMRQTLLNAYAEMKNEQQTKLDDEFAAKPYKLHLALLSGAQQLIHGIMGDDAGATDVPELAKRTGIDEATIKDIIQHRIGGSVFGVEGKGIRIPGGLQKLATGTYATAENTFVTGARRALNVNNADLKNKLVTNKVDDYQMQPDMSKLFDDSHNLNLNAYSVIGTIGDTSAQAAVFGLPSLMAGGLALGLTEAATGLGRGLKVGMTAAQIAEKTGRPIEEIIALQKKAQTISKIVESGATIGAGYTGSYESAYTEAARLTGDESMRRSYASWSAFWNGASELILSPADQIRALHGKGGAASFRAFERAVQETGSTALAGARMSAAFGKAMGKQIVEENIEELLVNYTDRYGEEKFLQQRSNPGEFAQKNIETIVQTSIGTLGMGIGGGIGAVRDRSGIKKASLFEAGNSPEAYKEHFEELRKAGQITQQDFNKKAQVINTMSTIVANLPKTDKKGRKISHEQKVELAAQQFRIAHNNAIIANPSALKAEQAEAAKDNEEAEVIQSATLTGEPVYMVDGTPVKREEFAEMIDGFHDAHLEVRNDAEMQAKLDDRFGKKAKEDEKIKDGEEDEEHDDSFDELTAASNEFASLQDDGLNAASAEFESLGEEVATPTPEKTEPVKEFYTIDKKPVDIQDLRNAVTTRGEGMLTARGVQKALKVDLNTAIGLLNQYKEERGIKDEPNTKAAVIMPKDNKPVNVVKPVEARPAAVIMPADNKGPNATVIAPKPVEQPKSTKPAVVMPGEHKSPESVTLVSPKEEKKPFVVSPEQKAAAETRQKAETERQGRVKAAKEAGQPIAPEDRHHRDRNDKTYPTYEKDEDFVKNVLHYEMKKGERVKNLPEGMVSRMKSAYNKMMDVFNHFGYDPIWQDKPLEGISMGSLAGLAIAYKTNKPQLSALRREFDEAEAILNAKHEEVFGKQAEPEEKKPVEVKPKPATEHPHLKKSIAIANDEIMQGKSEAEKNAKNDKPIIGNIGQANEERRKKKLSEAKENIALYNKVKELLTKHANAEDLIGDLTKAINEGSEDAAAYHAAIDVVRKAQEYELSERKKAIGNRIVSLQKDYNGLAKNRVKAKSDIMQSITQLAAEIGVTVSFADGKLKVMNGDKALVKFVEKEVEDNTGRLTVEDRGEEFGKFFDAMLPLLLQPRVKQEDKIDVSLPAENIRSAVKAIQSGKYNSNAFDLLDDLQEMYDAGDVYFTKTIGSTVVRDAVPVHLYLQTEEDIKAAMEQLTPEEMEIFEQMGIDPSYFLSEVPDFMVGYLDELLQEEQAAMDMWAKEHQGEIEAAEQQLEAEKAVPVEVWESFYGIAVPDEVIEEVQKDAETIRLEKVEELRAEIDAEMKMLEVFQGHVRTSKGNPIFVEQRDKSKAKIVELQEELAKLTTRPRNDKKELAAAENEFAATMAGEGTFEGLTAIEAALMFLKVGIKSPYRAKYIQEWKITPAQEKAAIEALKKKGLLNSAGALNDAGRAVVAKLRQQLTAHNITGNTEVRNDNYLQDITGHNPKKHFDILSGVFDKYGKKAAPAEAPAAPVGPANANISTPPTKQEQRIIRNEKDEAELRDAIDDFMSTLDFNSGINPETVAKGIKVITLLIKIKAYKFADMVAALIERGVPLSEQLITGMKHAYGAYISDDNTPDDHIDQMDDSRTVRKITFENVKQQIEDAKATENKDTTIITDTKEEHSANESAEQLPAGNETEGNTQSDESSSEEVERVEDQHPLLANPIIREYLAPYLEPINENDEDEAEQNKASLDAFLENPIREINGDINTIEEHLDIINSGRSSLDPSNEDDARYIASLEPELNRLKAVKAEIVKVLNLPDAVSNDSTQSGDTGTRSDSAETIQPDQGTQTGTVQTVTGEQSTDGVPDELGGTVQTGNVEPDGRRDEPGTGEGSSLAGDNGTDRPVDVDHGDTTAGTHGTVVQNIGTNYVAPNVPTRFEDNYDKMRTFEINLMALRLLVTLSEEGRNATAEEQELLASYSGWGGLASIVRRYPEIDLHWTNAEGGYDSDALRYREQVRELHNIIKRLDPDKKKGYLQSVIESTENAHYTPAGIIRAIYAGLKAGGFKGGYVLEPSAGIGNFFSNMPQEMMKKIKLDAIEKDPLTGQMLRRLYPKAKVQIKGYEDANVIENYYDLVIGNVPFGNYGISTDASFSENKDKRYKQSAGSIHNYFFVKSMKHVAPGGVMAFITSRYTMDGTAEGHKATRELIAEQGELIGAIRLPEHTFIATAGAEVTSDIIFVRKYNEGEKPIADQSFLHSTATMVDDQEVNMNLYYQENPHNVLGTNTTKSTRWGVDKLVVEGDVNEDLEALATEAIKKLFPVAIFTDRQRDKNEQIKEQSQQYARKEDYEKVGNLMITQDGQVVRVTGELYVDPVLDAKAHAAGLNPDDIREKALNHAEEVRMKAAGLSYEMFEIMQVEPASTNDKNRKFAPAIIKMRTLANKIFYQEVNRVSDTVLEATRKELRDIYNAFVKANGRIRANAQAQKLLANDIDQWVVYGLEKPDGQGGFVDADMLHKRTINPAKVIGKPESAWDAALISMEQLGKVDLEYMAKLRDMTPEEMAAEQYKPDGSGIMFEEPDGSWSAKDDYLSGDVKKKLREAKAALNDREIVPGVVVPGNPRMQRNIDELEKVIPKDIQAAEIYSPMEARWIPIKFIQQFINEELGGAAKITFSPSADKIIMNSVWNAVETRKYQTQRWDGTDVLERALNGIEPIVTYTDNKKTFVDEEDTITAKEKYRQIRELWDNWKYKDVARREELKRTYNDIANTTVNRKFDGSHLSLPGLMGYKLLQHQKDAIWRMLQTGGGILDHMVGAGKTLVMIGLAMEGRRLGMMKKPMIIGLKSQVPQMIEEFKNAYPLAKVLSPSPKDFKPLGRKKFMAQIASNDWDAVIITHDNFKMLKQPKDIQIEIEREMIEELQAELLATRGDKERKEIEKKIKKRLEKLRRLQDITKDEDMKDFSQLGVDFLMVDESQEFKNLEFSSNRKNVRGLGNQLGSQRSYNLLIATRYLQKYHGGDKGLLFASGTPIANTMGELYLLLKYLRPSKLKAMGLNTFDQWAGMFARVYSDLEYNLGSMKEINRFREFVNVPELVTMYREMADVRNQYNLGDAIDRPKAEHHLVKIEPTNYQLRQIKMLKEFIDSKGKVWREELGLTAGWDERKGKHTSYAINAQGYARKLSVDPRLINPGAGRGSKIMAVAENMAAIYKESHVHKGTQLVFCDLGTPKTSNPVTNVYNYILENDLLGQTDINEIFGADFENAKDKGKLEDLKVPLMAALDMEATKEGEKEYKAFLQQATDSQTFDSYTALRQELMQLGIPKEEIEFIHDHDGDVARSKLYARLNSGDVRVLIGSTGKMGVGVNVQQKAVAAHHMDINWKPSDLEQRNGRIERQKNFLAKEHYGNRVQIYYYATEITLDASMYEVVRAKARFIAQIKVEGEPARRMDDLEGDIDLGAMSAELSGDELFKEKNQLEKSVKEKDSLRNAFYQERYANEENLHKMADYRQNLKNKIAAYKNVLLPFYESLPREKQKEPKEGEPVVENSKEPKIVYHVEIPGHEKPFEKATEAGKQLLFLLHEKMKSSPVGKSFVMAKVGGATIQGKVVNVVNTAGQSTRHIERTILAPDGFTVIEEGKFQNIEAEQAAGTQLMTAIRDIPNALEKLEKDLAKNEEVAAKLKSNLTSGAFPHEEQLNKDRARLDEVNRLMRERSAAEKKALEERERNRNDAEAEGGDMINGVFSADEAIEEFEQIKWLEIEGASSTAVVKDGMSVTEVLDAMSKEEGSNVSQMAEALKQIITGTAGDVKIRVDFSSTMKQAMLNGLQAPRASRSHYNPKTNEIVLTAGDATIPFRIVHEAIHAAVASKLPPVKSRAEAEAVLADPEASQEVKHLVNLFMIAADRMGETIGDKDGAYAFTSLDEFVAEAFSNPDFQHKLARVRYTVNKSVKYETFDQEKGKTIWKSFIGAVKHLIGLDEEVTHTMLEAIISATRDVITYNEGILDNPKENHGKNGVRRERQRYDNKGLQFSEATNEQKRQAALTGIAFFFAKSAQDKAAFYQMMQEKHNFGSTPEQKRQLRIAFEEAAKIVKTINEKHEDTDLMNELIENASLSPALKGSIIGYLDAVKAAAAEEPANEPEPEETETDETEGDTGSETEEEEPEEPTTNANISTDPLANYNLKSTGDLKQLQSGKTFQDVYEVEPEGSQDYTGRRLLDMVEDGDGMVSILQGLYGNSVLEYGQQVPQIIAGNDWQDVCKEIVLLGRVLHNIQVEKLTNKPTPELKKLEKQIMKLYQAKIRKASLGLNAGRLLRILRDNDLGQYYSEKILSEKQRKMVSEIDKQLQSDEAIENIAAEEKVNPTEEAVNEEAENIKAKEAEAEKQEKVKKKTREYAQKAKDAIDKMGGDLNDLIDRIKNLKPKC